MTAVSFAKLLFPVLLLWQDGSTPDLAEARKAELARDFAGAEVIYARLVAERPNANLYQRLGLVRHMQNKFATASEAFEQAVRLDRSLSSSQLFLGVDLYRMDKFEAADIHLSIANRLRPNEPEILFWTGATKLARRDFFEGFEILETVLARDPGNTEVLRLLAESYATFGTSLLDEVGNKFPDSAAGLTVQGKAFEFEGAYGPALDAYRAAQALDPGRPELANAIARVVALLRQHQN